MKYESTEFLAWQQVFVPTCPKSSHLTVIANSVHDVIHLNLTFYLYPQEKNSVPANLAKSTDEDEREAAEAAEVDGDALKAAPTSTSAPAPEPAGSSGPFQDQKMLGLFTLFKNKRSEPNLPKQTGPNWVHGSPEGTSVDQEGSPRQSEVEHGSLVDGRGQKGQDREDNDESSGYEDAPSEFSIASTPDGPLEGGLLEEEVYEEGELNSSDPRNPKSPSDSCVLS